MFHLGHGQRLESLVLAHLSEENNTPALALAAAREVLERFRIHERVEVKVAGPDAPVTISARRRLRWPCSSGSCRCAPTRSLAVRSNCAGLRSALPAVTEDRIALA